jgi:hypothetical protein
LTRPVVRFAGSLPKAGCTAAECEDRVAASAVRFAVADGASEGSYSGTWAGILADAFCEAVSIDAWLDESRARWRRWERTLAGRNLPWFTQETLRAGSHAAFAGLSFDAGAGGTTWRATACGDVCVFLIRDEALEATMPLASADAFDTRPPLVATAGRPPAFSETEGAVRAGDRFYLVTDALAQWCLLTHERGAPPWAQLQAIASADDLAALVAAARRTGELRNDDVGLIAIGMVEDA